MKAHFLSAKEKAAAKFAAEQVLDAQVEDISARICNMWMCAMVNAGLSAKTVSRVRKLIDHSVDSFAIMKTVGLADYEQQEALKKAGIEPYTTKDEM